MTAPWLDGPVDDVATRHAALYRHARHHCDEAGLTDPAVVGAFAAYYADTYAPETWQADLRAELRSWLRVQRGERP